MKTPIQELLKLESDLTHMFDSDQRVAMAILEYIRNNKKEILEKEKENNMTEKYNGYTNYPTWRVNLEIISEIDFSECDYKITASHLEELVQDIVIYNGNDCTENSLAADYARAFLAEVNYHELASYLNEQIEERINENTN